jgi:hypothetical protein
MHRLLLVPAWLIATTACDNHSAPAAPVVTHSAPAERGAAPTDATPNQVEAMRALLRARHVEDLPDREHLRRLPHAAAALEQIAASDDLLGTRARALERLGLLGDVAAGPLLAWVNDAAAPAKLRAAAIEGLHHLDLDPHPEVITALSAIARGPDPRLAIEAVETLRSQPHQQAALQAIARDPSLTSAVREAAAR